MRYAICVLYNAVISHHTVTHKEIQNIMVIGVTFVVAYT